MKLCLDDIRDAPDDSWTVVRSAKEAWHLLCGFPIIVEAISLDHDLGTGAQDGYWLAKRIVEFEIWPKDIYVHSMNPVGKHNIIHLLTHYAPDWVTIHK